MEHGTDVKSPNKSMEMVADDNRRASDNLATRDYLSLQVVMPWAWMES